MSENFFGFDTDFPSKNVLGRNGLEEELLTADVEDEYDALNDETFGHAVGDDWEEAHEKLSESIVTKPVGKNSAFDDSLLEGDESQDDIVSKSISQLGLEDDLDDPAIMTISRNCHVLGHLRSFRSSSSPPPPAILETEICGSPKTHSIWSTTPKDSGISSFLQSLNHNSSGLSHHDSHNSVSNNVFITPPKAWRAEELERDLLSSSNKDASSTWPQVPQPSSSERHNSIHLSSSPQFRSTMEQNQNKTPMNKMLTQEEVERHMHSDQRFHFQCPVPNYVPRPLIPPPPGLQPNILSPIGKAMISNLTSHNQTSPIMPIRPIHGPMMGNNHAVPDRYFVNARMNLMHNQMPPLRGPANLPPVYLTPTNMNMKHNIPIPPRSIAHPLLNKQIFPMVVYNNHYENEDYRNLAYDMEDEYAGLMTQREKEWLIRIQLLQLKSENPYVEDYYFTTQVARRCQKKYSESAKKGSREAPELILPETTRHENKAFVPTQFEGSLGKLQAVSVNFPRKVLDWTEKKPLEDEEGKTVTNQSLMRYRQLLLDIERLYTHILEIEDEERRILAKPETESGQHRTNITKLTKDIFNGLFSKGSDYFQTFMTIRKGRTFVMRAFKMFNLEGKVQCLVHLLCTLSVNLKRDQNDLVLVHHIKMFTDVVCSLSLSNLVQLGEALESPDPAKTKDGNLLAALKSKFGFSVVCSMLVRAEALYGDLDLSESPIQERWEKFVLQAADCLCSLESSSIPTPENPSVNLLRHFQRFAVDRDKIEQLRDKLTIPELGSFTTG